MSYGAYVVTPDVDQFGFLYGGDDSLPVDPISYRWWEAYPAIAIRLELLWERGGGRVRPNIFSHNLLRDFVCDDLALQVIGGLASDDLRIIGRASLDGEDLTVIQVVTVLDVVDEHRSICSPYSWAQFSFPHISLESREVVRSRMFRIPDPGLSLMVLAGADVKDAYDNAGLRGLIFEPAHVEEG